MSDASQRPIVVKRIRKQAVPHHGGAWKIAYADFVTAMMAFFLLMWLLGSATRDVRQGIADYFKTPLKVALLGGDGAGDATSIIKGGGNDLTRSAGQIKRGSAEEAARIEELRRKLQKKIDANPRLSRYKNQIRMEITDEGLLIEIVDERNRPMFDLGSPVMKPYMREILREIGKTIEELPNKVSITGHTDSLRYANGAAGYGNWELSSERANASRRELVAGGLSESKIARVVGLADSVPRDKSAPDSPLNRRIAIVVLYHR